MRCAIPPHARCALDPRPPTGGRWVFRDSSRCASPKGPLYSNQIVVADYDKITITVTFTTNLKITAMWITATIAVTTFRTSCILHCYLPSSVTSPDDGEPQRANPHDIKR